MRRILIPMLLIAFALGVFAACESIEDEINKRASKTETIDLDITDDWVPLIAIEQDGYSLTAMCYADSMTVDAVIGATSYADVWDTAKEHIDSIEVQDLAYRVRRNISTGGRIDLFLLENAPPKMVLPGGLDPGDLGIDDLTFILVDPDSLPAGDQIGYLEIPNLADLPDWTDGKFVSGGKIKLEETLLAFEDPFVFCMSLDIPTREIDIINPDIEPDLELKLSTIFDVVFTPL